MAESFYARRARELGLNVPSSPSDSSSNQDGSYFTRRAQELGLNLNPQPDQPVQRTSNYAAKRLTELQQEKTALAAPSASHTPETNRQILNMQERRLNPTFTPGSINDEPKGPTSLPTFQQQVENIDYMTKTLPAENYQEITQNKARNIPVIGPALGAYMDTMDKVSANPVVKTVGEVGQVLYTPGAGLANVNAAGGAIRAGISRLSPKIGNGTSTAAKAATEAIAEGALSVPLTAGNTLANNPGASGEEFARNVALGAGLGAVGGAAVPAIGKGVQAIGSRIRGARTSGNAVEQSIPSPTNIDTPTPSRTAVSAAEQTPEAEAMKGNWFTSIFGNRGVGIAAGRQRSGRNTLTSEGQIVDNPLRTDIDGVKAQAGALTRAIRQDYEDFTQSLKHIGADTYDIAQDARRANNLANTSINDKFVDVEGNVIGQSLKEIGNKIARGEGNAFQDYLILRHAKTRVGRGERVYAEKLNMNDVNKIQARIDELDKRYPQFAGIAQEWDGYWKNLRNLWEKEGLITPAQNAAMETENPFYSPMRRQFNASEKYSHPFAMRSGFSGQKAPIKEVSPTGSVRKIVNPFRSAIEQTGASYNAIMRNRVMQNVYQKLQQNPELLKGIVEIVPESADATKKTLDEINELIRNDGIEGLAEKLDTEFLSFRKGAQKGGKADNIVTAMIDGKPVKMRVENPEVFNSLIGLGPEESNLALDFMGALSNATKYGATGALAPLFATRSLTTDVVQSIIQSKNPIRHISDLGYAVVSAIADKLPQGRAQSLRQLAQDFRRAGGEYSAYLKGDRGVNRSVDDIVRPAILSGRGMKQAAVKSVSAPFKVLNSISDIAENLNRMAAYQGELRRQGFARSPEAIRAAMRESQEITTNFSRRGLKSQGIEKVIPYSNAAIQGLRRFAQQWKKNPVKTSAMVGGMVLAPKLYEYAMFSDDPDYQKIPAREKYRNLIVGKNTDGSFIKIPMPVEYNGIGAAMVDLLTAYKDGDPVNWRQSADSIVNAYTPPFISGLLQGATQGGGLEQSIFGTLNSTSLAAPIAVASNQSFTGAPIVPQRLQGASPAQQYDESTSSVGKWVGEKLGMSPKKVDYLLRAYGGDPARLLLPLTSDVGSGNTRNTLLKNFITDPAFTNTLATDYYDMKEKITQAEADNKLNGVPFPSWYTEAIADIPTSQKKGGISKRLSDLSSQKRTVQGDNTLTAKQKTEKLRDIQAQMNELYLDAITRMREGGVPTGR